MGSWSLAPTEDHKCHTCATVRHRGRTDGKGRCCGPFGEDMPSWTHGQVKGRIVEGIFFPAERRELKDGGGGSEMAQWVRVTAVKPELIRRTLPPASCPLTSTCAGGQPGYSS